MVEPGPPAIFRHRFGHGIVQEPASGLGSSLDDKGSAFLHRIGTAR